MSTIAFLYPGQGTQKVGMGAALFQECPHLFETYVRRCDEVTGLPITQYCFEGPLEKLTETHIAQPALFALSLALTEYARQTGLVAQFVAGHSLGEYTAAVASGALTFEDGLYLVCQRGQLMHEAQLQGRGSMAAVFSLTLEELEELCEQASTTGIVRVANINSPTQLVVSGMESGVEKLISLVAALGRGKIIRLRVGGAFHSPLMKTVRSAMQEHVELCTWHTAHTPSASNASGELVWEGAQIRQGLVEQITRPVQWTTCIQRLVAAGCDTFIELGAGQTLTKLVNSIVPHCSALALDSPQKIDAFMSRPLSLK